MDICFNSPCGIAKSKRLPWQFAPGSLQLTAGTPYLVNLFSVFELGIL
jgi:hypothetical protein